MDFQILNWNSHIMFYHIKSHFINLMRKKKMNKYWKNSKKKKNRKNNYKYK